MVGNVIEINNVSKSFKNIKVLDDISLNFEAGRIYGIIGRNGAGKTMLMKCICGFVMPDEGYIKVQDRQIGKDGEVPDNIGIIIEDPGFLPNYDGFNNLKFLASIKKKLTDKEIKDTIQLVGLNPEEKKHVGKYSLGMRQRLGIAQAIMEHPDVLILDEPMNGLDNRGVEDVREMLLNLKKQGKTIILASHSKEDIGILCDEILEMDYGKVVSQRKRDC